MTERDDICASIAEYQVPQSESSKAVGHCDAKHLPWAIEKGLGYSINISCVVLMVPVESPNPFGLACCFDLAAKLEAVLVFLLPSAVFIVSAA